MHREPSHVKRRWARSIRVLAVLSAIGLVAYGGGIAAGVLRNPFTYTVEGQLELARSTMPGRRILFVGNSLTYRNDLPRMLSEFGERDAPAARVITVSMTRPASQLEDVAGSSRYSELLSDIRFDAVVLQPASGEAAQPEDWRADHLDPAVRSLTSAAATTGARTVLFAPWGQKRSEAMGRTNQQVLGALAHDVGASVAPIGLAWIASHRRNPEVELYDDNRHATRAGSYLAAAVLYGWLTGRNPRDSSYDAGLEPSTATALRNDASRALDDAWVERALAVR